MVAIFCRQRNQPRPAHTTATHARLLGPGPFSDLHPRSMCERSLLLRTLESSAARGRRFASAFGTQPWPPVPVPITSLAQPRLGQAVAAFLVAAFLVAALLVAALLVAAFLVAALLVAAFLVAALLVAACLAAAFLAATNSTP